MQHDETLMLAVSDLHCGSTVGLTPPDFPLLDDGAWKLNKVQDWIWQQWSGFVSWATEYAADRPLVLLLNGDLIEGVHHGTKEVVHADPGIHARMAVECLLPLARIATRIYVVRGTGAHVGHSSEDSIARTLGAVGDGGIFAKHHWMFRVQDTVVSAKHHISTSSRRALRGTSLSINLEEERAECAAASYQMPDLLIRSHRHVYGHYSTEESQIVVTPAWQALTSYGWKVVPNAVPRIGGVMIDWNLSSAPVVVPWTRTPERNRV